MWWSLQENTQVTRFGGLPGDSVLKNPLISAADVGLILTQEDPTAHGATKHMHNYWVCAPETGSHNCWSPCTTESARSNGRRPTNRSPRTATWEQPMLAAERKAHAAVKTQHSEK